MARRNECEPAARALRRLFSPIACGILAVMMGCKVGPDYKAPQTDVPPAWTRESGPQGDTLLQWWTTFNDPTLTSLVDNAVLSNLDLKQAESRIRAARASRGIAASGLWPTVDLTAGFTRSRSGGNSSLGTGGRTSSLFQAGVDASWEMDVFGGVKRNVESADAAVQAAVEDRRDAMVTLAGEIGLDYIQLRGFQQRIAIARKNLEAQEHTAKLTHERQKAGFASALDVANAEAQVATTASQIPGFEASARQTIYSLSILLAKEPTALVELLDPAAEIPAGPPDVPVGVPSDLLRRRPDIRRAEAQIHQANAQIGVATADLFPKFTIGASAGFQGNQLSSWFNWASRFWSIGPSVDWQIFNGGRFKSNIELQKALTEQAGLSYQQAVLAALQDVENALIAGTKEQEHRKALTEAAAQNRKALDLATKLYTQGLGEFLNVLDAERSLYASEDALVQSTQNVSTDLIALYKALGGGWQEEPAPKRDGP